MPKSDPVKKSTNPRARKVRVVTHGPAEPVRVVTDGIGDMVRVTTGRGDPVRVVAGGGTLTGHSIWGTVRQAVGGMAPYLIPLPGVTVTAGGHSDVTDVNGLYRIEDLNPGTYTVTPVLNNFSMNPLATVVVLPDNDIYAIDFDATQLTFSISGTITNFIGTPLNNVVVTSGAFSVTTNPSGVYQLTGLPAGNLTVTPSSLGYNFSPVNIVVATYLNQTGVDFTGVYGGKIVAFTVEQEAAGWVDPDNIIDNDASFARHTVPWNTTTGWIRARISPNQIPPGSMIDGYTFRILKRKWNMINILDTRVQWRDNANWFANNKFSGSAWIVLIWNDVTYGGSGDKWGTVLSAADLNTGNYGITFSARNNDGVIWDSIDIQFVRIIVYYH